MPCDFARSTTQAADRVPLWRLRRAAFTVQPLLEPEEEILNHIFLLTAISLDVHVRLGVWVPSTTTPEQSRSTFATHGTYHTRDDELVHRAPNDRVHAASTASSSNASNVLNSRFILRDQSHHQRRLPVRAAAVSAVRDAIPSDAQRDAFAARPRALGARNHANANYLSKGRAGQAGHLEFGHQHIGEGDGAASRAVPQSAAAAVAVNTAGEAAINHANGA